MTKSKHKTNKRNVFFFSLVVLVILSSIAYSLFSSFSNSLPVLGEPGHQVGSFSFTDQDGNTVTDKTVQGKIRVAEYFFTTCKSICPIMNRNMQQVQDAFRERNDVVILSHTVNPSTDSVPVLKKYAEQMHALPGKWEFLTGTKISLYQMAEHDYLLSADSTVESNEEDAFIHTQYVALVDRQNHIRGFYEATDKKQIEKLIADIKKL